MKMFYSYRKDRDTFLGMLLDNQDSSRQGKRTLHHSYNGMGEI